MSDNENCPAQKEETGFFNDPKFQAELDEIVRQGMEKMDRAFERNLAALKKDVKESNDAMAQKIADFKQELEASTEKMKKRIREGRQ